MTGTTKWSASLLVGALALTAVAQDEATDKPTAPALAPRTALAAEAGQSFRFARTAERTGVCEALSVNGNDSVTQEYSVNVESVADDGAMSLTIVFGPATGHYTTGDGTKIDFDSADGMPDAEDIGDLMSMRGLMFLADAKITATVDAQGNLTAVDGMREAVARSLAGTAYEAMAEHYPEEEAKKEVQRFLPPLPSAENAAGKAWTDEANVDFGGMLKFDFQREWRLAKDADGNTKLAAECKHVMGDSAPEGQTNSGEGTVEDIRGAADGFVLTYTEVAAFHGKGKYDVETTSKVTIERLAAESPEEE